MDGYKKFFTVFACIAFCFIFHIINSNPFGTSNSWYEDMEVVFAFLLVKSFAEKYK